MSKLTVIFTANSDNKFSKLISKVTKGEYTHVALKILNSVLEAFVSAIEDDPYPGIWLHEPDRYDNYKNAVFVDVEVPNLRGAEREARRSLGTYYGLVDCITSGIYNLTGASIPGNGKHTMNCSETVVRILRAGGVNILPGINADSISPMDLYRALIK